jgi:hypothetical protein
MSSLLSTFRLLTHVMSKQSGTSLDWLDLRCYPIDSSFNCTQLSLLVLCYPRLADRNIAKPTMMIDQTY